MKKMKLLLLGFLCVAAGLFSVSFAATLNASAPVVNASPVGFWQQYDDHTGQLESVLHIAQQKDGTLVATPVKAFAINGKAPDTYCTKCSGKLHNAKIIGMTAMWGMKQASPTQWGSGHIVDPKSGRVYRCKLTLMNSGQDLKVHGYIGISLIGRSQIWKRMK
jgi:uncharacterized protein (DUF2147 family)